MAKHMLKESVEKIIKEQKGKQTTFGEPFYYPVDITLTNGNILLRAFRILSFKDTKIQGITWKEEYSAPREQREEVYSYFELDEIATLNCFDLGIEYDWELTNHKDI